MTKRNWIVRAVAALLVGMIGAATLLIMRETLWRPTTISAYFASATAIYPGDEVRVAGINVGRITSIQPQGSQVKMTFTVKHDVPIPADAKALIVAANLISARYVELTPAYRSSGPGSGGPKMPNGAVIPIERTAVPVEWDQVKEQLMRLATDLGPNSQVSTPSIARFIDSAANALGGNGDKLRQTLAEFSGLGRVLANGSGNIATTIKNLQTFVTALRDSKQQIVQFQDHFATLTSVLNNNRSDLDAALTNLSEVIGEVQRFVAETRDKTTEQVQRLSDVTSNLVAHRKDIEQLLHVAGTAVANGYADYDPDTGTILGSVSFNNFSNPVTFLCAAIAAVKNSTSEETAKLCALYLGPALRQMNFNNLPIPINPYLSPAPHNVLYTDPSLAPGGGAPGTPEPPLGVSAYTGLNGDQPPPAGWNQSPPPPGLYAPTPSFPLPALLYPGAPRPAPPMVENLLLPAQPGPPTPPGQQPSSEGEPPS